MKQLNITLNLPDLEAEEMKDYLLNEIALELYKTGIYSLGFCTEISTMDKPSFMRFVSTHGVSLFKMDKYLRKELGIDDNTKK